MTKVTKDSPGIVISLTAEPDDDSPEGHFASGDAAADRETVREINARLDGGDDWAWFCAHVCVTYRGVLVAHEYLGGCSYRDEAEFRADPYFADMVDNCIDEINRQLTVLDAA